MGLGAWGFGIIDFPLSSGGLSFNPPDEKFLAKARAKVAEAAEMDEGGTTGPEASSPLVTCGGRGGLDGLGGMDGCRMGIVARPCKETSGTGTNARPTRRADEQEAASIVRVSSRSSWCNWRLVAPPRDRRARRLGAGQARIWSASGRILGIRIHGMRTEDWPPGPNVIPCRPGSRRFSVSESSYSTAAGRGMGIGGVEERT